MTPPLPKIRAIAAMASNRVIGRDGTIPWRISDELRWFKQTTLGHTILMGRRTWDSLGRPLPGRHNIVLSRTMEPLEGVQIIRDLGEPPHLGEVSAPSGEVFVIGGGEVYARLLPWCEELILSVLPHPVEGDTLFPEFEPLFEPGYEVIHEHPEFQVRRYRRLR